MNYNNNSGTHYIASTEFLGQGNEGNVYGIIDHPELAVKMYHSKNITKNIMNKLEYMLCFDFSSDFYEQIAWPLDILKDCNDDSVGYIMHRSNTDIRLSDIISRHNENYTFVKRLVIAQNICVVTDLLHHHGVVIGDFNPNNIGIVSKNGRVFFFDTDSYHFVIDKSIDKAYRCTVCASGLVAPELIAKCIKYSNDFPGRKNNVYQCMPLDTFTKETDLFALAVIIFKLLSNGVSPFNNHTNNKTITEDEAVFMNMFRYEYDSYKQNGEIISLNNFPKPVQELIWRAFVAGSNNPQNRPSAKEWYFALNGFTKL